MSSLGGVKKSGWNPFFFKACGKRLFYLWNQVNCGITKCVFIYHSVKKCFGRSHWNVMWTWSTYSELLFSVVWPRCARLFLEAVDIFCADEFAEQHQSISAQRLSVHGPHAQLHASSEKWNERFHRAFLTCIKDRERRLISWIIALEGCCRCCLSGGR